MMALPFFFRLVFLTVEMGRCAWGAGSSYGASFTLVFPEMNASSQTHPYAVHAAGLEPSGARHVFLQSQLSAPHLAQNVSLAMGQAHIQDIHVGFLSTGSMGNSLAASVTSEIDDVAVYVVPSASGDAFTAFPDSALGREYYCVTFCPQPGSQCQINVVAPASSPSVNVEVHLPPHLSGDVTYEGVSYSAGGTISKTLSPSQSMQIQSNADLTGTRVVSVTDISVLAGAVTSHVGRDKTVVNSLVEQMPPVTSWGMDVVAVPVPLPEVGSYFRILACQDRTTVRITGETSFILRRGQWVQRNMTDDGPRFVWASKPILVVRFTVGTEQAPVKSPTMLVLVPVEQFPNRPLFLTTTDPSALQTLTFVIEDKFKNDLLINGTTVTSLVSWDNVNDTNFAVAHVQLPQDNGHVTSTASNASFMVYVYRAFKGQAFFGAMNFDLLNPPCTETSALPGDSTDNDCNGLIDEAATCTAGGITDCGFASSPGTRDLLGRHFVLSVPYLRWTNLTHFSVMMATTSSTPVTVEYSSSDSNGTVSFSATDGYRLLLPETLQNNVTSRTDKTVVFTSSSDVSIYAEGRQVFGSTQYASARLIPVDGLGTEYFAVCLCQINSCQVSIVAAFPQTVVRIRLRFSNSSATLHYAGKDYSNRGLLVETLAQYESLHLIMKTVDMTGSHVTSDKPIAVFGAGSKTTNIQESLRTSGSPDGVWEQIIPVQALDREYVTYNAPDRTSTECLILQTKCKDSIRIVATEENTKVNITDVGVQWLRHAGDFLDVDRTLATNLSFWLEASRPVMVVQLPLGDYKAAPAMQLVPPISQFASSDVVRIEKFAKDASSLILLADDFTIHSLQHRNSSSLVWTPVGNLYYAAHLRLTDNVSYTINTGNSPNRSFWGFLYSGKSDIQPGALMLPLNFLLEDLELRCRLSDMTVGDTVDNDCDGRIDEEICDNENSDDDYDGMENEDCQVMTASSSSLDPTATMTSSLEPTATMTSLLETTVWMTSSWDSLESMTSSLEPVFTSSTMPYTSSVESTLVSIGTTSSSISATVASSTWLNVKASLTTTATAGSTATSTPTLSTSTTAVVTSTTTTPSLASSSSLCSCGCVWHSSSLETAPISQVVESIVRELSVDKSSVSAKRRSKESAPDVRTSAKTMGYFGVAIISAIFTCIVILDAGSLIRDTKRLLRNIRDCFRQE